MKKYMICISVGLKKNNTYRSLIAFLQVISCMSRKYKLFKTDQIQAHLSCF